MVGSAPSDTLPHEHRIAPAEKDLAGLAPARLVAAALGHRPALRGGIEPGDVHLVHARLIRGVRQPLTIGRARQILLVEPTGGNRNRLCAAVARYDEDVAVRIGQIGAIDHAATVGCDQRFPDVSRRVTGDGRGGDAAIDRASEDPLERGSRGEFYR